MNALDFLLDVAALRDVDGRPGPFGLVPLSPDHVASLARRRQVPLPVVGSEVGTEDEHWAATVLLSELGTALASCLVADPAAGREILNAQMGAWAARPTLEDEVGPDELPGLDLEASALPRAPVPLSQYAREGDDAEGVVVKDATLAAFVLAAASILLTEAVNVHLSGYADRVRACAAPDCLRPFLDTSKASTRRFCSATCRARAWARRAATGA